MGLYCRVASACPSPLKKNVCPCEGHVPSCVILEFHHSDSTNVWNSERVTSFFILQFVNLQVFKNIIYFNEINMLSLCMAPHFNFWTGWPISTKFDINIMPLDSTPALYYDPTIRIRTWGRVNVWDMSDVKTRNSESWYRIYGIDIRKMCSFC
jgi:hypothetical protein